MKNSKLNCCAFAAALAMLATAVVAQEAAAPAANPEMEAMMAAWETAMKPGEQHEMLAKEVGSWKATQRTWMEPGGEPMVTEGTSEREMTLGGRILENRYTGDMMGQAFHGIGRTGYDNVTGKYWGTWTDSMSTGVYLQYGTAGDDGAVTYKGDYVDPISGDAIKVRSVVRWEGDDTQVFEWYEDRGEGEVKSMEIVYERQPS